MPLRRPTALLFDLDGTLVDSRQDIAGSLNAALEELGRARLTLETVLPMIGDGARALIVRALTSSDGVLPDDALIDRGARLYNVAYLAAPCVHTTMLPGVAAALALGIPCALVTNKPRNVATLVIEHLGISAAFAAIYGGGDGPLKPSPDGIRQVCAAMGVVPADTWFIGDGPQDVLAGKSAGCVTIAVPGIAERSHALAAEPDVVLESLEGLPALLPT